ncbi:hypothetical protein GCM10010840_25130 [Deinococcus aerolatus]|uniref:Uncharacterized protein n=1 Tax=Deinococcus aerolatus TaxID=522487 RepID=A0ABQ2GCV1_9DEIO|nr:hypothetical protein GCM10010840_25130 [Deinococcus aerolatus]
MHQAHHRQPAQHIEDQGKVGLDGVHWAHDTGQAAAKQGYGLLPGPQRNAGHDEVWQRGGEESLVRQEINKKTVIWPVLESVSCPGLPFSGHDGPHGRVMAGWERREERT